MSGLSLFNLKFKLLLYCVKKNTLKDHKPTSTQATSTHIQVFFKPYLESINPKVRGVKIKLEYHFHIFSSQFGVIDANLESFRFCGNKSRCYQQNNEKSSYISEELIQEQDICGKQ